MKLIFRIVCLLLLGSGLAAAQDFPGKIDFQRFAAEASETVDVTLDANMLSLAKNFLSDKDADEREAKQIVSQLKGIYVRSYEFDKEGVYSDADVESIRTQFKMPEWNRIVGVRSKHGGENSYVFVRQVSGKIDGLVVVSAEPREFTVVYINGPIDIEKVTRLGGQFGIPRLDTDHAKIEDHKSKGGDQ